VGGVRCGEQAVVDEWWRVKPWARDDSTQRPQHHRTVRLVVALVVIGRRTRHLGCLKLCPFRSQAGRCALRHRIRFCQPGRQWGRLGRGKGLCKGFLMGRKNETVKVRESGKGKGASQRSVSKKGSRLFLCGRGCSCGHLLFR
jgi:hypothetical protein